MGSQIYPTIDEIKAKKKEFLSKTAKAKKQRPNKSQQLAAFLTAIKPEIKQSISNGASNPKIIKAINETYGVKVSLPSFAKFCEENGVKTNAKPRKRKI